MFNTSFFTEGSWEIKTLICQGTDYIFCIKG